jgi:hypothetical protein
MQNERKHARNEVLHMHGARLKSIEQAGDDKTGGDSRHG